MDANKRLRELLDESGWTEYKLSKNCGLSQSTLANIFKRNNSPSIKTLEAICNGFSITLAQFFSDGDMVELTPELREIFERWMILTQEQKDALLTMLQAFQDGK